MAGDLLWDETDRQRMSYRGVWIRQTSPLGHSDHSAPSLSSLRLPHHIPSHDYPTGAIELLYPAIHTRVRLVNPPPPPHPLPMMSRVPSSADTAAFRNHSHANTHPNRGLTLTLRPPSPYVISRTIDAPHSTERSVQWPPITTVDFLLWLFPPSIDSLDPLLRHRSPCPVSQSVSSR